MTTPLIEFGYSELASFEFAQESRTLRVDSVLASAGESVNSFEVQAVIVADLATTAASVASLEGQTVLSGSFQGSSSTTAALSGMTLVLIELFSAGSSIGNFAVGYARSSALSSSGLSTADFAGVDGINFDFKGVATVTFFTNSYSNSTLQSDGEGIFYPHGQHIRNAVVAMVSTGQTSLIGQARADSVIGAASSSVVVFPAVQITNANMTAAGAAVFTPKLQGLFAAAMNSAGLTTFAGSGQAPLNAVLASVASSSLSINTVRVINGAFTAPGLTVVNLLPGKPVRNSMPPAFDVVIRPAESRAIIWPGDDTSARWK